MALLSVSNLKVQFSTTRGVVHAVNGVDFSIEEGEILALVGESGSGKTVTGLSILGLLPKRIAEITEGDIVLGERPLLSLQEREMRQIRGREISVVFQNPMTALDPFFPIGKQMEEIIRYGQNMSKKQAREEARSLLEVVGIHEPDRVLQSYPFALSGGMRQRIIIAMALSRKPKLLIADEPTTALDATMQKQVISLFKRINKELGTAILLITHDFGVVSHIADKVAVMYAGRIVEYGKTRVILNRPEHPYTQGLLGAVPALDFSRDRSRTSSRLLQIDGQPPDLLHLPQGCSYLDRCKYAGEPCSQHSPEFTLLSPDHRVRCVHKEGLAYAANR